MKSEAKSASEPIYVVWEGDMMLDAPVIGAWPHIINYPSWQNYSIVQHISGLPGLEGEVMYLKKEETVGSTAYFARTIKLDPGRRVIWKTYRDNTSDFGIVEFSVDEVNGKTRFSYKTLYEISVLTADESERQALIAQSYEGIRSLLGSVLPKLKQRVEK